jgi:hypothetical protein
MFTSGMRVCRTLRCWRARIRVGARNATCIDECDDIPRSVNEKEDRKGRLQYHVVKF